MASSTQDTSAPAFLCRIATITTMLAAVVGLCVMTSMAATQSSSSSSAWLLRSTNINTRALYDVTWEQLKLISTKVNIYDLPALVNTDDDDGDAESATDDAAVKVMEDHAILSGWKFSYRYPSTLSETTPVSDEPIVITGVISKSHHRHERRAIRTSWANDRVYFVVAGPWQDIQDEFLEYGDILWLNMEEDNTLTTNKVQLLLHAVDHHVETYDYIVKTKDSSFVDIHKVEKHLLASKPNFWGNCIEDVAHGVGYVLSRKFNECAASLIESLGLLNSKEDVATAQLAHLCGYTCQDEGWNTEWIRRR